MKTSVYVPDELWKRVQEEQPDASASQLLQDCLRARLDKASARPYAVLTAELAERAETVRSGLQARLIDGYRIGFRLGLLAVESLPTFDLLGTFATGGFDLEKFQSTTDEEEFPLPGHKDVVYFEFEEWWANTVVGQYHGESYVYDYVNWPSVLREGFLDGARSGWGEAGEASLAHAPAATQEETDGAAPE